MQINEKLIKKFIESTIRLWITDLSYVVISEMINDKYVARHPLEKDAKRIIDVILYMKNNLNQVFNKNLIEIIYFFISSKKISDSNINKVLCCYYSNYNEDVYKQAVMMNLEIKKMKIYRNHKMAFMMANFILLINNICPIIIYEHEIKSFTEFDSSKSEYESILGFWHEISSRGSRFHFYKKSNTNVKNIDEIINIISSKKELFTEEYMIKSMFLFGSVTRNVANEYSDIDIIVLFKERVELYKKNTFIEEIKKYLNNILETSVDVCVLSEVLKFTDDLRSIKKII